eukprot:CAMPEP_0114525866 /NCGR_PEP_ID=MMETSP0109-20121206/22675_1 /TAXON_ID=29199 /ORGANISM="Chlorarachnion reptans, Strain CCCM449" /LENGTH=727 /DNA_ID=CAMNT_0001707521 /DNA_START=78 /DNA_END=2261 /DNA_ORIENTATION=+
MSEDNTLRQRRNSGGTGQAKASSSSSSSSACRKITLAEMKKHRSQGDLWISVNDNVYDISKFLKNHPGGNAPLSYGGKDASAVFFKIHNKKTLAKYHKQLFIGSLTGVENMNLDQVHTGEKKSDSKSHYDVDKDEEGYDNRKSGEEGREFGDLMALEGETSNIPVIIVLMYVALYTWGFIASLFTGSSVWTMFVYYMAGMAVFYVWHFAAHHEWSGEMHEIHMEHHLIRFPPSDFYGSAQLYAEMYPDGKPTIWTLMDLSKTTNIADGTTLSKEGVGIAGEQEKAVKKHTPLAHEGPLLIALLSILVFAFLFLGATLATTLFAFILYLVVACVGNALHMSFHVRGFHLEKYAWYRELRTLHYIHHLGDMKSNLAMLNLGMDGFFKSLTVTDPTLPKNNSPGVKIPDEFIDILPLPHVNEEEEDEHENEDDGSKIAPEGFYRQLSRTTNEKKLPQGISLESIAQAAQHSGASATILGFDLPLDKNDKKEAQRPAGKRGYPTVTLRLILTTLALQAYFATEAELENWLPMNPSNSDATAGSFTDPGHLLLAPFGGFLTLSGLAPVVCCISVFLSDVSMLFILAISVLGPTFRPMMSVIVVFYLRLALRIFGASMLVPQVPESVWVLPTWWPTLFSRHDAVANSFFSGRVSIAAVVACELVAVTIFAKKRTKKLRALAAVVGIAYVAFNIVTSLALKASWTFDILVALAMTRYSTIAGYRLATVVDTFMP